MGIEYYERDDPALEVALVEAKQEALNALERASSAFLLVVEDGQARLMVFGTDPQPLAYRSLIASSLYAEKTGLLVEMETGSDEMVI